MFESALDLSYFSMAFGHHAFHYLPNDFFLNLLGGMILETYVYNSLRICKGCSHGNNDKEEKRKRRIVKIMNTQVNTKVDKMHRMLANNLKVFSMLNAPWSTLTRNSSGAIASPIDLSTTLALTTIAIDGS
ncbi:hypothetical protein Tco_0015526 [Tanacetum coccineum]